MNNVASSLEKNDTFPKLLLHHSKINPSAPAYRQKSLGIWQTLTWLEASETAELLALGLQPENIAGGDRCTFLDARRFYSYRRDKQTGRMATLVYFT